MTIQEIKSRLLEAFPDGEVDVADLTGTSNHIAVDVASAAFTGLSRIKCHQKVMGVFSAELKTGELHALTIQTKAK